MNTRRMTWKGHAKTILATDISTNGMVASVSEDGYCILWSFDGKIIHKTVTDSDVDSVAKEYVLNSVKFVPNDPDKLFISSESKVLGFDVRNLSSPFAKFEYNKEEINQISISDKGEYLAACDDDGEIKIIDLKQERLFKTLFKRHTNICSSVQFRPKRPWQVVSVGMDCNVIHWDFSTGKSRQTFNMNEHLQDEGNQQEMFINPPFVHSLCMSKDGLRFAVGLGNGSIGLFNFKGKSFQFSKAIKAHGSEVSQVNYFEGKSYLVSGSNDGKIKMWKDEQDTCSLAGEILHGSKINWLICSSLSKNLIIVADQSSNVNIYESY